MHSSFKKKNKQIQYNCEACNISCTSEKNLNEHRDTEKHKINYEIFIKKTRPNYVLSELKKKFKNNNICISFNRGNCYNNKCPYRHILYGSEKNRPCYFHNNGGCSKSEEECKFIHKNYNDYYGLMINNLSKNSDSDDEIILLKPNKISINNIDFNKKKNINYCNIKCSLKNYILKLENSKITNYYLNILENNEITDIDIFNNLSEDDFKEMGFKLGSRKKFLSFQNNLNLY